MNYDHEHKYFIFKTFETYAPVDRDIRKALQNQKIPASTILKLGQRVEMAILGCPCGDVIKQEVRNAV